jgi:uncharacterized membrane protein
MSEKNTAAKPQARRATVCIVRAAAIAALYAVVTAFLPALSYGPLQFRFSEALTILPLFFAEAVPGLAVGCLLANVFSMYGPIDMAFGTLATLAAALITWQSRKIYFGVIPPIVINALVVPLIFLMTGGTDPDLVNVGLIALTQSVMIIGLGTPLYFGLYALAKKNVFIPTVKYMRERLSVKHEEEVFSENA